MAEFRFNFGEPDDDASDGSKCEGDKGLGNININANKTTAVEVCWIPSDRHLDVQKLQKKQHTFGKHTLLTVTTAAVEDYLLQQKKEETCEVVQAITGHSDLVAGQYEGGLKVWECSIDLCEYLADCDLPVEGGKVLELGCGGGLPGMLATKMGAASVHFQDFNQEVLEVYTMVNLVLNNIDRSSCAFFAGDWDSFASLADSVDNRYDLILTSETIYNVDSYPKLLRVFSLLLTKSGVVLVAAKCDYFGVGGSVPSFIQYIQANGQFEVETVKHINTGVPRKILQVTRA
ncbi:histidine protein methyltransferase 1 homolog [Littorina saxatilis]|uniref:protein-histidine N-methyltransferase n=1 Tax=Littorina saxatilis TaxID=31220 RepID=A0AAN9BR50_9CAEN